MPTSLIKLSRDVFQNLVMPMLTNPYLEVLKADHFAHFAYNLVPGVLSINSSQAKKLFQQLP
jgi:Na+/serine symporter